MVSADYRVFVLHALQHLFCYIASQDRRWLEFGQANIFLRSDNQDWNGPAIRSACYDAAVENRSQPWLALLKTLGKRGRPFIVSGWTLSVSNVSATQKMLAVGMGFDSCDYLLCTGA